MYLKTVYNLKGLPPAIFGILMICASIFLCFTPETKDITLVQKVSELKTSGKPSLFRRLKKKLEIQKIPLE